MFFVKNDKNMQFESMEFINSRRNYTIAKTVGQNKALPVSHHKKVE